MEAFPSPFLRSDCCKMHSSIASLGFFQSESKNSDGKVSIQGGGGGWFLYPPPPSPPPLPIVWMKAFTSQFFSSDCCKMRSSIASSLSFFNQNGKILTGKSPA